MSAKADLEKRNAAWLYFVEKKKYNEIAAVLNITPDQASRRVHQAQAGLKRDLEKHG